MKRQPQVRNYHRDRPESNGFDDLCRLVAQYGDDDEAALCRAVLAGKRFVKHRKYVSRRKKPPKVQSYVYFLRTDEMLKIGVTEHPERLERDGDVLGTVPGDFEVEARVLQMFKRWSVGGGMHALTPPVRALVDKLCTPKEMRP